MTTSESATSNLQYVELMFYCYYFLVEFIFHHVLSGLQFSKIMYNLDFSI